MRPMTKSIIHLCLFAVFLFCASPAAAVLDGISKVAAGGSHTCVLTSAGGVQCWGANSSGQLGDGTTTDRDTPVDVVGLTSGVASISAFGKTTCAVTTAGGVKCWGENTSGQLGDGTTTDRSTPVNVSGLAGGVGAVSIGSYAACALTTAGGVKCWGGNAYGQLGDGTTTERLTPVDVSGLSSGVTAISVGSYHTCALTTTGGVKCWGDNENGQLGDGTTTESSTPVDVSGLSSATAISLEGTLSCAVSSGALKCWGEVPLSSGSREDYSTPVDTAGLTSGVASVALGSDHFCVLTTTNGIKCWWGNYYGQLGDGTTTNSYTPVDVTGLTSGASQVATGDYHSCAVTSVGGLKCWGQNEHGQLANGSTTYRAVPYDLTGFTGAVSQIVDLSGDSFCILTTDSGVKCWGSNSFGQLGDGTTQEHFIPASVLGLETGVQQISGGSYHACALTTNGGAKCWGLNSDGELGDGTYWTKLTPVDVSGLTSGVSAVFTAYAHSCALTSAGGVKCWGDNWNGELGNGETKTESNSPVDVSGLGNGVAAISTSFMHTCALTTSGGVKCWGNSGGGLGNGTSADSATPVDVSGLSSGVAAISAGAVHTCALTTSGAVKCWGENRLGELGDGTTTEGLTPVDVSGLSSGVTAVSAGFHHTCALTTAGAVKCWGDNRNGQLGDGTTTPRSTPVDTLGLSSGVSAIFALNTNTCAIKSGKLLCWGQNKNSYLGAPFISYSSTPTSVVRGYTVSGTVTRNGSALAGVSITSAAFGVLLTDANGAYSFPPAIEGTAYTVTPSKTGFSFTPTNLSGTLSANVTANFAVAVPDTDSDGVSDEQEVLDGTNPNDRGSVLPVLSATLCSEWNGFLGGMWNIMEHVNMSSSTLQIHSVLYSITGEAQGTADFTVDPGAQFDLLAHDLTGWTLDSYGKVCSTVVGGDAGSLDGRMVYYKALDTAGTAYDFAFAMPFLNGTKGKQFVPFNTYQPSLDSADASNLVANWIQLTNLETTEQQGTLIFHAQDGSELGSTSVTLAGGARQDFSGHQFGTNLVGIIEWRPSDSTAEFQLRNVRYLYDNPGTTNSFDTAFQLEGMVGTGELISVPLDTTGASAIIEVANTANLTQDITVKVYSADGTLVSTLPVNLPAYGSVHLITDTLLNGGKGMATIQGPIAEGVIAVAMEYGRTTTAGIAYMYGIPARQSVGSTLRSSYNTFLQQGCELFLVNPTDSAKTATINMVRYTGATVLSDETVTVPGHGLVDYNLCANEAADNYGVATVQPATANSLVSSVVRHGVNDDYRFPTPVRQ